MPTAQHVQTAAETTPTKDHPKPSPRFTPRGTPASPPRRKRRGRPDMRYICLIDREVAHLPAGSLHFDPSVRRKWLARLAKTKELSSGARALGALLASRSSDQGKHCWGFQTKIAEELNVTDRAVRNWCRELEEAGAVVVERCTPYLHPKLGRFSRRWTNRYHLVVDLRDHGKKIRELTPVATPEPTAPLQSPEPEDLPATEDGTIPEHAQAPPVSPSRPRSFPPDIKAAREALRRPPAH